VPDATLDDEEAVAVKILKIEDRAEEQEIRDRFRREIRICAQLDHPHIVRLIDWSEEDPCGLVMELIDGESLRHYVRDGGLPLEEAMRYARPVLEALDHAHRQGIMHRDLKPENVMVTRRGTVKVMDFGLARAQKVSVKLTRTDTALGTPDYMAPEQISGNPTPASDQYAAGLMVFELLTGRRPFAEGDLGRVLMQHLTETPTPLGDLVAALRGTVEPVVARMLEKDPAARYRTMGEALKALEEA
jgi:serine/threonine-protein kinase